jgi:hypothetical protein
MNDLPALDARLHHGADLPATLAASFDAFEAIRSLARRCQDVDPDLFAAFMTTASEAADGRDAITTAPSLPLGAADPPDTAPMPADDPAAAADAITALATVLARRLDDAADQSATPGDRAACRDAAEAASGIRQVMTSGDRP